MIAAVVSILVKPCVEAATADQTVTLTVKVSDEEGKPVSNARVNVHYQGFWNKYTVQPPDYQNDTSADGIARIDIKAKDGEKLAFSIEVSREDMETKTRDVDKGRVFPTKLPLEKFTLTKKSESGTGAIINVAIDVQNEEHNSIEGASVVILDTALGTATGRFPGATGGDGRATIPVLYGSADPEEKVEVDVSKNGYKNKKTFINLNKKQVGTNVLGGTVMLEKIAGGAATVNITVIDKQNKKGVGDATVVLDGAGYHSEKTNGGGNASLLVPEIGTFAVRISQDNYEPFTGEIRLLQGEQEKALTFELEPKEKKDEGNDTITVTVLAKDPTDEKSRPAPLPGALVKAGGAGTATDGRGQATLKGAFDVKQEVTVSANGYKSQSKVVGVAKILHYSNGTGSTTFTLDPDLSENSPIRLIVEVRGPNGSTKDAPINEASVDFLLPSGRVLYGGATSGQGERDFRSSDAGDVPIAELRKGLAVTVKKEGYKEVNRSVPADLLQPSNEARRFAVQLEKDWSALTNAIAALEARVGAWNSDKSQGTTATDNAAIEKARAARGRAEGLFNEIEDARHIFDVSTVNGVTSERCRKAGDLKKDIQACETEANQKAQESKQLLDEAAALASTCTKPEDAEIIKSKHGKAIKLVGEIGTRNKKAVKDRDELMAAAKESLALRELLVELRAKATAMREETNAAQAAADSATENYKKIAELSKTIARRQIALKAELAVLTVKYATDTAEIPPDLTKRIDAMERLLGSWKNDLSFGTQPEKTLPESITSDLYAIARLETDAEMLLTQYRTAACDIDTMEQVVNGIDTTLTNASFELGLAADLPKQAEACAEKAKTAAADEVTVPDISNLGDLDQMSRAVAQAGMVLAPAATSATPPGGEEKLFGPQNPPPNSKAKRGDPVTIVVYQKVAEEKAKAANPPEEELVVVPGVSGAQSIEYAGIILEQAGFKAVFNAVKPKEKKDELKIAGQNPAAGEKKKRGSTVVVFIAQKYESPEASSTADASPTAPGTMPSLIGLTLDQATTRLTSKMRIGGDEVGDKPPTVEKALTIYSQTPAAGSKITSDKPIVVSVKRYGSGKEAPPEETPGSGGEQASSESGDWVGTWGTPETKAGDAITIGRDSDGYVLSGALVGKGPPVRHGVVQGGQLLFHTEVDPRDVVGIAIGGARSEADKTGKKKDDTFQVNFKFVRQGDTLDFDLESIEPGGKTTRQDFKGLRRMKQ